MIRMVLLDLRLPPVQRECKEKANLNSETLAALAVRNCDLLKRGKESPYASLLCGATLAVFQKPLAAAGD
jgi:hypothetical protein